MAALLAIWLTEMVGRRIDPNGRQIDPNEIHNVADNTENKPVIERLEKELQKQIRDVDISQDELPASSRDKEKKKRPRK